MSEPRGGGVSPVFGRLGVEFCVFFFFFKVYEEEICDTKVAGTCDIGSRGGGSDDLGAWRGGLGCCCGVCTRVCWRGEAVPGGVKPGMR